MLVNFLIDLNAISLDQIVTSLVIPLRFYALDFLEQFSEEAADFVVVINFEIDFTFKIDFADRVFRFGIVVIVEGWNT